MNSQSVGLGLGVVYAVIIIAAWLLTKSEAAVGAISAVLATLSNTVLRQLRKHRLRRAAAGEGNESSTPEKVNGWFIVLLAVGFLGLQNVLLSATSAALNVAGLSQKPVDDVVIVFMGTLSYIIGGYLCGKTVPIRRYTYVVLPATIALVVNTTVALVPLLIGQWDLNLLGVLTNQYGVVWLLYIAGAGLGARCGFGPNGSLRPVLVSG
jgi:hypothetical protein